MTIDHEGGCLCGAVRYKTTADPQHVVICHCTFCQRFTGSAFLVAPVFKKGDVELSGAKPQTYDHQSDESKKRVTVNFCGTCGTTVFLDFERFPDICDLCGGTFDDPNWFDRSQGKCRHIFTRSAQEGVVLPPNIDTYEAHALQLDGTPNQSVVFAQAVMARQKS